MMVVTTDSWDDVQGVLQRFERKDSESWQPVGAQIPVVVGQTGLAWGIGLHPTSLIIADPVKKEADKKAPAGIFSLGPAFGFAPGIENSFKLEYLQLNNDIEAIDDPQSNYYNQIINRKEILKPDWQSSEQMGEDPLYALGLVINHNYPKPKSRAGSAIFIHIWRNNFCGTAGCTAMSVENVSQILEWLDKDKNPVLVQLPQKTYTQVQREWQLPYLCSR